jgi:hypothetical protein
LIRTSIRSELTGGKSPRAVNFFFHIDLCPRATWKIHRIGPLRSQ